MCLLMFTTLNIVTKVINHNAPFEMEAMILVSGMKSIRRPLLCHAPRHLKVVSPSLNNFTKCKFQEK